MCHRIGATEVDCRAAEAVLAAAHIERASGHVGILLAPVTAITLGLSLAVACAIIATEGRAEATGTSAGIITNDTLAS